MLLHSLTALSIFLSGFGMGIFPIFVNCGSVIKVLKVFSGGVILGLSIIHIMPDGMSTFNEIIEYPIGGIFICSGLLFLIMLNFLLTWYAELSYKHEHSKIVHNHECPLKVTHEHNCVSIISPSQTTEIVSKIGTSYIMELGCLFHSLIIGLSIGISNEYSVLITLMIAISFHQGFEGLALGIVLSETKTFSIRKRLLMILFYSVITPVSIFIGNATSNLYDPESYDYKFVEGSLNCFSCGLLLYVSLYNLLCEEFTQVSTLKSKMYLFVSTILGIGIMAVIAIWN